MRFVASFPFLQTHILGENTIHVHRQNDPKLFECIDEALVFTALLAEVKEN
jgi:hypothetical protein